MGIEKLAAIDNLDDRTEIMRLLGMLTPSERREFMQTVVDTINTIIRQTRPSPWSFVHYWTETGEVNEVYTELFIIAAQYNVPVQPMLSDLEKFVSFRRKF